MALSKEVLNEFAKLAADGFLKNKTSMTTSLTKIAKDEALEPHQIEYVAATANHKVWEKLYTMDKKASYDFPVADPVSIIGSLQTKPARAIVKEASLDYLSPPTGSSGYMEKTASMDLESVDVSPAKRREMRQKLQQRLEKCAQAKEDLSHKMIELRSKYELVERDLMKQARALVMEQPFEARGAAMSKIAEFVGSACEGDRELACNIMKKLAAVVKGQGLVKQADLKAPEEYIDKNMPAKIVNGRHALYITIKTLRDIRQEYDPLHRGYEIVDSSLPVLKEKIRGL